jgi:hypothetical protein
MIRALLHHKWMHYGVLYYLVNLAIFLVFLSCATGYSLSVPTPFSQDCKLDIAKSAWIREGTRLHTHMQYWIMMSCVTTIVA